MYFLYSRLYSQYDHKFIYLYLDLECVPMNIPKCTSYSSGPTCHGCVSGYYLASANLCVSCILPCLTCYTATICYSCDTSQALYIYQSNKCYDCNYFSPNCLKCGGTPTNFTCGACMTGYYSLNTTTCTKCSP